MISLLLTYVIHERALWGIQRCFMADIMSVFCIFSTQDPRNVADIFLKTILLQQCCVQIFTF